MYRTLLLAFALCAATAFAEDEPDDYGELVGAPTALKGVGRMSIQLGWRMSPNETFYRDYYTSRPGLERAPGSPGGPLFAGSFGYSFAEFFELSIDLVVTGERLRLTQQPTLTTGTFSSLVGFRFQKLLSGVGPEGLVPFVGALIGPTFVVSRFKDVPSNQESNTIGVGTTLGATLRLSPRWGLTAEYRLTFIEGRPGFVRQPDLALQSFSPFNAGGHWLSVGFAYWWPPKPSRGGGGFTPF